MILRMLDGKDRLACNADLGCACLPKLHARNAQADRRRQATMVAIKMAVESFRQSKTLLWDAKTETVRTA